MDQQTIYQTLYTTIYGGGGLGGARGLELSWENLTVKSKRGEVRLLKDICGSVQGRFLVVMGPSGSGKTTFLNQLSMRGNGYEVEAGKLTVDGQAYSKTQIKHMSGYVMQDDILFGQLTVEETLTYAARLKMHPSTTAAKRAQKVNKVIKLLGLEVCRNVVVGSPFVTGISGGQRKRLSVGIELLTRPQLLFLDEPTSGLDSVSAAALIETLRMLAHKEHVTVVATLHQPSSSVFRRFDDLMILAQGQVIYHGPAASVTAYYARAGLPCPPETNPADHALDAISTPEGLQKLLGSEDDSDYSALAASQAAQQDKQLARLEWDDGIDMQQMMDGTVKESVALPDRPARLSWPLQTSVLLGRCLRLALRQRDLMIAQLVLTVIMALLIGFAFYAVPDTAAAAPRKSSSLFFCAINQGMFGAMMTINTFPVERAVIMRERASGMYYVSAYFVAKCITEVLLQLVYPVIFSCIVYFLIGYRLEAGAFFVFLGFLELCFFCANSVALLISAAAVGNILLASAALPLALEISRLFGGFFLPPAALPIYFVWLDSISYVKYIYMGLMTNQFSNFPLICPNATNTTVTNALCVHGGSDGGDLFLKSLGINYMPLYACALVAIGLILVMRVITWFILRVRP